MDYSLSDELIAIESIYGPDLLTPNSSSSTTTTTTYTLHVPRTAGVQLLLLFPSDYPFSIPKIEKVVSTGTSTAHGWGTHVLESVRTILDRVWIAGEAVLFPLLEELVEGEVFDEGNATATTEGGSEGVQREGGYAGGEDEDALVQRVVRGPDEWFVSETVVEKKSTFIAHAAQIATPDEAKMFVEALLTSDRKFEKATHNISALRGRFTPRDGGREVMFQDCDDDGEDAAGGRLLHLLELTESWNVLVVVSRWYGGIKLGPDRFRIINQVARDALVKGHFVNDEGKKVAKKGK